MNHIIASVKNVIMALTKAGVHAFFKGCNFSCIYSLYAVIVYTTSLLAMIISLILPYAFCSFEYASYKFALCPFCKKVHDYNVITFIFIFCSTLCHCLIEMNRIGSKSSLPMFAFMIWWQC